MKSETDKATRPRILHVVAGFILGLASAFIAVLVLLYLFPLLTGKGADEMSQGIMGTLGLVFLGPVFGVAGAVIAFRRAGKQK